ncbi:MAG: hypothetical protein HN909_05275 [Phycisphaerales bacterium]|jgi:hypothetical protein|nr:hypothetical protein [Phycisphaerales bacterium]MBT7171164.1 hypothetical protein [Phycisphaerales bacterium]
MKVLLKLLLWLGVAFVLLVGFLVVTAFYSPSGVWPADNYSTEFKSHEAKVAFLETYVPFPKQPRTYIDLDFHVCHMGTKGWLSGLGPTEWNIKVIAKVPPEEIPNWIKKLTPIETIPEDMEWVKTLPGSVNRIGSFHW